MHDYALFKLKSSGADHFEYKLNDGNWEYHDDSKLVLGPLEIGRYELQVRAVNAHGVKDPVPARFIWNVNEALEVQLDNPLVDTKAKTSHVAVTGQPADLSFSIDGGPRQSGAPRAIGPLAPGDHTLRVWAGKATAPLVSSWVQEAAPAFGRMDVSVAVGETGWHELHARATDPLGLADSTGARHRFFADFEPPVARLALPPVTRENRTIRRVNCTDNYACADRLTVSIDGGAPVDTTRTGFDTGELSEGPHQLCGPHDQATSRQNRRCDMGDRSDAAGRSRRWCSWPERRPFASPSSNRRALDRGSSSTSRRRPPTAPRQHLHRIPGGLGPCGQTFVVGVVRRPTAGAHLPPDRVPRGPGGQHGAVRQRDRPRRRGGPAAPHDQRVSVSALNVSTSCGRSGPPTSCSNPWTRRHEETKCHHWSSMSRVASWTRRCSCGSQNPAPKAGACPRRRGSPLSPAKLDLCKRNWSLDRLQILCATVFSPGIQLESQTESRLSGWTTWATWPVVTSGKVLASTRISETLAPATYQLRVVLEGSLASPRNHAPERFRSPPPQH